MPVFATIVADRQGHLLVNLRDRLPAILVLSQGVAVNANFHDLLAEAGKVVCQQCEGEIQIHPK